MASAYPFCDNRTPSVLRKTRVSLSDATAALATTKATVARSGSVAAQVRLTQNRPGISGSLPRVLSSGRVAGMADRRLASLDYVGWRTGEDQKMSCQTTPCGQ